MREDHPPAIAAWMLDWPYSSIVGILAPLGLLLAFPWVGLLIYWLLSSLSSQRFQRWLLVQSLVAGMLMFFIAMIANGLLLHGYFIDVRHATYMGMIKDPRLIMYRLPFFLSLLVSIWVAFPVKKQRRVKTVM
jgi:hypothetical protein